MIFTMLLEPCKLPPTAMLSEHKGNNISEIITQLIFFFFFLNGGVKTACLCIYFVLVAANMFNDKEKRALVPSDG